MGSVMPGRCRPSMAASFSAAVPAGSAIPVAGIVFMAAVAASAPGSRRVPPLVAAMHARHVRLIGARVVRKQRYTGAMSAGRAPDSF